MRNTEGSPRWLAVLLGVALLAGAAPLSAALAEEPASGDGQPGEEIVVQNETSGEAEQTSVDPRVAGAVYVSVNGNDTNNGLTDDAPVATLAHAVEIAHDGDTIYVMSDLTMSAPARYWDKNLTITSVGGPWTLTRCNDGFKMSSDTNLGGYNGAMIEVGNTGSLTITNLILDDNGNTEGTHYVQVAPHQKVDDDGNPMVDEDGNPVMEGGSTEIGGVLIPNSEIVQDGIIATYSRNVTITLGEGTQLKNYGGMSAVRVSGGTLVMQSGSQIFDDKEFDRAKGDKSDYGFAGAVWIQSGTFTLEEGASIHDTDGHAIYADGSGSSATVNGSIYSIASSSNAWNGTAGVAVHLRGGADLTLNGSISKISGSENGNAIYILGSVGAEESSCTMNDGSVLRDCSANITGIQLYGSGPASLTMNGEITGLQNTAIHMNEGSPSASTEGTLRCSIGQTGSVHDNGGSGYGTVTMQTINGTLDVYGKIIDNFSTSHAGICMAHNMFTTSVTLHDGAEVSRNYSTGGVAGINASFGSVTIEEGASVSDNVSLSATSDKGAGVYVSEGCLFVLNGGTVSGNVSAGDNAGVVVKLSNWSQDNWGSQAARAELNSGTIDGNVRNATVITNADGVTATTEGGDQSSLVVTGGEKDYGYATRHLSVSNDANIDYQNILFSRYGFNIENPANGVKLGNASTAAESAATAAYTDQQLATVVGSFWYETTAGTQLFSVSDLTYDADKSLYAALVATDETGAPVEDAAVPLYVVTPAADGSFSLNVPGQNATGYAVVFLQETPEEPTAKVVTVTPADLTVYEGGDGYSAVVGSDGATTENSLPHPMFRIEGVDDPTGLTFANETANKSWTVVSDGDGYYHFEPAAGQDDVRVTYTNAAGEVVTSDQFDVSDVSETFAQYAVNLYLGENNLANLSAKQNDDTYAVALGSGTLTVRAVEADNPSDVTSDIATAAPDDKLAADTALAVEPEGGTTYTLNDTGVTLPSDARPQLLFDDIITSDGVDRASALRERVDKELGGADPARQYQMKYLDLVDSNNSNAWITSENGIDIYWAYPEGTDESTNFSLLHLKGLHRDGAQSGFDVTDVDGCDAENVTIENTAQGIRFHVAAGDFSPYVLTWEQHTITATAGEGGSISPSGAVIVADGADQAFTITPDEGYAISDVKVDGVSVGAVNSYAFSDVTGDHTIDVSFRSTLHTITASAGEGGTITPNGAVTVADGADQAFTITPDEGYAIADVKVDGVSVGAVNSYAFGNVTGDHTIEATFVAESVTPPAHEHVWSDWKHDEADHWKVCEECGAVKDRSEHVFGAWEQVDDGLWERSCTVCGYVQEGTTPVDDTTGDTDDTDDTTDDTDDNNNVADNDDTGVSGDNNNAADNNEAGDEAIPYAGDDANTTLPGLLAVGGAAVAAVALTLRGRRNRG